jgi:hypothetical protein
MTNKQALEAKAQCPVSSDALEVALIDREVNPATTYDLDQQKGVELALMDLLFSFYTQPDIREGDYSVSHPDFLRKIKERVIQLATKYGATEILDQLQDAKPTITGKSVW